MDRTEHRDGSALFISRSANAEFTMKDFLLLFAVGLVVVAGVVWFLLPGPARDLLTGSKVVVEDTSAQAAAEKPEAPPPPVKARPQPVRYTEIPVPTMPVASTPSTALVRTPAPQFPFPVDVVPGEEREDLIDGYGQPALSASTQDQGHLFETYVYRSNRSQAIIQLEDGKVAEVTMRNSQAVLRP